jgi:hypothetical protein
MKELPLDFTVVSAFAFWRGILLPLILELDSILPFHDSPFVHIFPLIESEQTRLISIFACPSGVSIFSNYDDDTYYVMGCGLSGEQTSGNTLFPFSLEITFESSLHSR